MPQPPGCAFCEESNESLRPEQKEQQSVEERYDSLIGKDAAAAFQARWSLLETPSETVALLSAKLLGESAVDLGDASLRTLAVIHAVGNDESKSLLRSIHERDPNSYLGQQAKRLLDSEK